MSTDDPRRTFDHQLTLPANADSVWRALTDPDEVRRWFAPSVTVTPGVRGEVAWSWPGCDAHWVQAIEVWEEGRHLRTRYHLGGGSDGPPLFIDFHLSGRGGETTLRLVQSGFGAGTRFDEEYDGISRGWPVELGSLRHYLEHHRGRDRQLAAGYVRTAASPDRVWDALFGGAGAIDVDQLGEAGQAFAIVVPGAGRMEGTVLGRGAEEWTGAVDNLGDAWVRWSASAWGGATTLTMWLALYGREDAEVRAWHTALDGLAARVAAAVEGAVL